MLSAVIKRDHQQVYDKYQQVWALGAFDDAQDKSKRKALVVDLVKLIMVHANVEMAVLYPILHHLPKHGMEAAQKATGEHQEVELLLAKIEAMDVEAAQFCNTLKQVMKMFKHHADDEEKHLLPEVDNYLQSKGGDLMARTIAEYEHSKTHAGHTPHPAINKPGTGKDIAENLLKSAEDAARLSSAESAHLLNVTTGQAK